MKKIWLFLLVVASIDARVPSRQIIRKVLTSQQFTSSFRAKNFHFTEQDVERVISYYERFPLALQQELSAHGRMEWVRIFHDGQWCEYVSKMGFVTIDRAVGEIMVEALAHAFENHAYYDEDQKIYVFRQVEQMEEAV